MARKIQFEEFVRLAREKHGEKYWYDRSTYSGMVGKVKITCTRCTYSFRRQASVHVNKKSGCPRCALSKPEKFICEVLKELAVNFATRKTFAGCKNQRELPFDFFLLNYGVLLEYDGDFHTRVIPGRNTQKTLERQQRHDQIKTRFAGKHMYPLYRFSPEDSLESIRSKLEAIKNEYGARTRDENEQRRKDLKKTASAVRRLRGSLANTADSIVDPDVRLKFFETIQERAMGKCTHQAWELGTKDLREVATEVWVDCSSGTETTIKLTAQLPGDQLRSIR